MALTRTTFCRLLQSMKLNKHQLLLAQSTRPFHPIHSETLERHRTIEKHGFVKKPPPSPEERISVPEDLKNSFPEFAPNPVYNRREQLFDQLQRNDMFSRRNNIRIPEFYVGSSLAVTVSDQFAPGKKNRFVGICIERGDTGLRSWITLRNAIENQGVEVRYELYNPLICNIDVLRLEKRLDPHLRYLRDAPIEYSYVPFDMVAVPLPDGSDIPVNDIKVKLNRKPWLERWERQELLGVEEIELKFKKIQWRRHNLNKDKMELEKYDLMKHYRSKANQEEMDRAYRDFIKHRNQSQI